MAASPDTDRRDALVERLFEPEERRYGFRPATTRSCSTATASTTWRRSLGKVEVVPIEHDFWRFYRLEA